ncbi:MAG: ribonuclease Z [Bacteroidales bacterium]|nr:ribonuclease Z [Bacteroidales bacterium]MCB9013286.1 ribonuclease Z [Bacteroidales bacterium]
MKFSLTILGSSSAAPTSKRFPTAHLLNVNERFFLVDCGEGTQIQLRRFKLSFAKINRIFISHIHGDHVFGLFGLLSSFQLLGRKNTLHIHGPGELQEILKFYQKYFGSEQSYRIQFHALGYTRKMLIHEDERVEVFSFPLKHRVPTCGFLFCEKPSERNLKKEAIDAFKPGIEAMQKIKKGEDFVLNDGRIIPNSELTLPQWKPRSYAYCSDTSFCPELSEILQNIDLLYHEATFSKEDEDLASQTAHSSSVQAAKIALACNAGKLLIGHFSSRYKSSDLLVNEARELFVNTIAVNDGDEYVVERIRLTENGQTD